jgi:hypothetical protein
MTGLYVAGPIVKPLMLPVRSYAKLKFSVVGEVVVTIAIPLK